MHITCSVLFRVSPLFTGLLSASYGAYAEDSGENAFIKMNNILERKYSRLKLTSNRFYIH